MTGIMNLVSYYVVLTLRDSWHEVIGMSSSDAMGKYITAVGILDPDWETTYLNPLNPSAEQVGH